VEIAYALLGSLGLAIAHYFPEIIGIVPPCLFRYMTGIPCPACGATRSGLYISQFQIAGAFTANPFFFGLFVALLIWGINTFAGLVFKKNLSFTLSMSEQKVLRVVLMGAFFISWVYLILTTLI